ncbi:hypothetical protein Patl1_31792 [Pistacia atlantica]|uniref:Uncharacterized protein n=1 Tax=Pistacia atlantica TaxID=434234 RepID=A0ACC1AMV0_9ROSI|nr:hypothetical protein Patl1_31792 [Pistacia atlantica]
MTDRGGKEFKEEGRARVWGLKLEMTCVTKTRRIGGAPETYINAARHASDDFDLSGSCKQITPQSSCAADARLLESAPNIDAKSTRQIDRICDVCRDGVEGLFYRCKECEFDVHPLCTTHRTASPVPVDRLMRQRLEVILRILWSSCFESLVPFFACIYPSYLCSRDDNSSNTYPVPYTRGIDASHDVVNKAAAVFGVVLRGGHSWIKQFSDFRE